MNGYYLFQERDRLQKELSAAVHQMAKYGNDLAAAEANYKVSLAQTALKLKDDGMAATMINLVVYGTDEVPKKRLQRDIAEVMYRSSQENIQSLKLQLRLAEAELERTWGQAKRSV